MIKRYRHKPTEVEAMQFTDPGQFPQFVKWMGAENIGSLENNNDLLLDWRFEIKTDSGNAWVYLTDFVIQDIEGNFYPCTQSVFEQSYEVI